MTICGEAPGLPPSFQSLDKLIPYVIPYSLTTNNMLCRFGHLLHKKEEKATSGSYHDRRKANRTKSSANTQDAFRAEESGEDSGLEDLDGAPPSWEGTVELRSDQSSNTRRATDHRYLEKPEETKKNDQSSQRYEQADASSSATDLQSMAQQLAPM